MRNFPNRKNGYQLFDIEIRFVPLQSALLNILSVWTKPFVLNTLLVTREFRVKLLVSTVVNVNFTGTFVIPTLLCNVHSVCSLTRGVTTTGSKRQQFVSPVVAPY
jgi:hypothetical protein